MKRFTRLSAIVGLVAFAATAFAQTPPPPPATPGIAPGKVAVKGYTRKMKNGKTVTVKGYTRSETTPAPKMGAVKGYTRRTKSGKTVTVKGYTRQNPTKGSPMSKPGQKMTTP